MKSKAHDRVVISKSESVNLIIPRPWWQEVFAQLHLKVAWGQQLCFPFIFLSLNVNIYNYYPMSLSVYFWTEDLIFEFQRFTDEDELCFPGGSDSKESACKEGDLGSIPGLGRSPEEGNGYPLQYFGLEIPWTV